MHANRPVNLNLIKFHFPPMAILSICHRIAGVFIFLLLPLMFYLLSQTLLSEMKFEHIQQLLNHNLWLKLAVWLILSSVSFHFIAGVRHLIMDLGYWESARGGRVSAYAVFAVSLLSIILAGFWIW